MKLYQEYMMKMKGTKYFFLQIAPYIIVFNIRTIQEKMCKMQRTRDEMNAFKVAQSIWRDKQKKELEEENLRIQEYIKKISEDERKRFNKLQFNDSILRHLSF